MIKYVELKNVIKSKFIANNINDFFDIDYIIASVLKVNINNLITRPDINSYNERKIMHAVNKRIKNIPVDIIFHNKNFYGYDFYVNKFVLSPRKETELIVERTDSLIKKMLNKNSKPRVLDLCSGSGIIGIVLKKLNPSISVTSSDISRRALRVAKKNAKKLNVQLEFIHSDLFDNINGKFDIIVSNPPYIPTYELEKLDSEVQNYDPTIALDGGKFGLDFYKKICAIVSRFLNNSGTLIFEIGYNQGEEIKNICLSHNLSCIIEKDYSGLDRMAIITKK